MRDYNSELRIAKKCHKLKPGDRIITPTGQRGKILPQPWGMPYHQFVLLDDGRSRWFLAEILELENVDVLLKDLRRA
jgi:hypothetical protein